MTPMIDTTMIDAMTIERGFTAYGNGECPVKC